MINFYLPNFYQLQFYKLNLYFIEKLYYNPEYFYDNIKIGALYGSFPGVIWNGGRTILGSATIQEISEVINNFYEIKLPLRFTYTNCALTSEHLHDIQANIITQMADNGINEILVNSPELEEYLRKTYPRYKFISSTTKCLLNKDDIVKEVEKYYLTVLDYRKNPDIDFLSSLPNPEKYEILLNAYCDPECDLRQRHYDILSHSQINGSTEDIPCTRKKDNFFEALENFPTVIKVDDLYNKYVPMGFQHFKIEGRTNNIIDVLESYIYYMVKPEFQTEIRYEALKKIFGQFR